jgi:hypothetical protein
MISLTISEIKSFMAKLLAGTVFDNFILKEMEIQTFTSFHISGQFLEAFFSKEELAERGENRFIQWSDVKNIAFTVIKGSKTPLSMKIVFQLPTAVSSLIHQGDGMSLHKEEVGGLYLNVRFDNNELHIITGTAMKTFTMDKTAELEWDQEVKGFLKQQGIQFEEA